MQTWFGMKSAMRVPVLFLDSMLLLIVFYVGTDSLGLQQTSAHYQSISHWTSIATLLPLLAVFGVQELVRNRIVGPPDFAEFYTNGQRD